MICATTKTLLCALLAVQLLQSTAGQSPSPSNLNPSPEQVAATSAPPSSETGPFFSCIDLTSEETGFLQNFTAFGNLTALSDLADQYLDTINYTAAGQLAGTLQTAVNLRAIRSDYQELQGVLNDGLTALGNDIQTLLTDVNYTSILNILANIPDSSDSSSALESAGTFLVEFANSLNVTTLGQFLVNVSSTAQLPRIGGLVDNMLSNVNFTLLNEGLAQLPSVIDFAHVGGVSNQIVAASSVNGAGNATQDFIRDIGNNYISCQSQ